MGALVDEAVGYAIGELLPLVMGSILALAFILAVLIVLLWGVRWDWWRPGWLGRGIR